MTILEIFEKVNLIIPMEQRMFFNLFEDTVNELQALYGDFIFIKSENLAEESAKDGENQETVKTNSTEYTPPKSLNDDNVVLPLFHNAIVDNILFLANKGEIYKSEFLRKSKDAYFRYWKDNAKGRRIRRMRW